MSLNLREKCDRWRCSGHGCRTEVGLRKYSCLKTHICLLGKSSYLSDHCWIKELKSIEFCKHELSINKNTVFDAFTFVKFVLLNFWLIL